MNALRPLLPYLRRHRLPLTLGFTALVLSDLFQLASPWVFKVSIEGLETTVTRAALFRFGGLLLGLSFLGGLTRFFMRKLVVSVSREIEYELRNDFYAKLTSLPHSFYNRTATGDLMAKATNDLNAVRMVLGPGIMYSVNTVVTLTVALTLMIILSWPLTVAAMVTLPLISLFMYRYGKVIHHRFEDVQEQFSAITARAQEYLAGIRVVKAYVQERAALADFGRLNEAYLRGNMRLVRVDALFSPTVGFLAGVGTVLVLGLGGWLVMNDRITLGTFVAFNTYLIMLIWPMIALGWVVSIFQRGAASMKRLNEVLEIVPEIADPLTAGDGRPAAARGALEFRGVRFEYPLRPGVVVLDGIDLTVAPGETVAVVGRTGSGKTTLVNLVPRLLDPTQGSVLLDGHDLREFPLAELRRHIGYVPQETFLFSRTVAENISLGEPDAGRARIEDMALLARLAEDVQNFPDGYETMVGERGVTLSGGQKQRTAIARALLRDPAILILDDALSSVDTRTEDAILSGLRGFMKNRTTLLVAHRVSTVKLADRIIVLDGGRIAEQGTHEALLAAHGMYAELVQRQELEEQLETMG